MSKILTATRKAALIAAAASPDSLISHSAFAHEKGITPKTFSQMRRDYPDRFPPVIVRGNLHYATRREFEAFLQSLRQPASTVMGRLPVAAAEAVPA